MLSFCAYRALCTPAGVLFLCVGAASERKSMIILNGKYNSAKVFTEVIEQDAVSQIIAFCSQPMSADSQIRIMPDVHAGAGCTIGTTMTITDKVIPNLVGVDIGCGMETVRLKEKHIELQKLDKLIYEKIPSGFAIREKPHRYSEKVDLTELSILIRFVQKRALVLWAAEITSLKQTRARTAVSISLSTQVRVISVLKLRNTIRMKLTDGSIKALKRRSMSLSKE